MPNKYKMNLNKDIITENRVPYPIVCKDCICRVRVT